MNDPLRDRHSVSDLAGKGQVIEINGVIGEFDRLAEVVAADLGVLDVADVPSGWRKLPVIGRLAFNASEGDGRAARLTGELDVTLVSVCQRCLQPFEWQLATTIGLLLVESGDVDRHHDGLEVWELEGREAKPVDIVDEALVMAMPLAVRHEKLDDCIDLRSGQVPQPAPEESGARMTSPFAGLAEQMGKGTKD